MFSPTKNSGGPARVDAAVDHVPGLLPQHLADLRKSGLTDDTIRAAEIVSEFDVTRVKALLDTKQFAQRCLPVLVFPYKDAEGRNGYCRVKPDHPRTSGGKLVKYESPRGQPNQIYLPPGVADVLADATRELLITEGEKKALAATASGVSVHRACGGQRLQAKGQGYASSRPLTELHGGGGRSLSCSTATLRRIPTYKPRSHSWRLC